MNLSIQSEIFESFPKAYTGVMILSGINNRTKSKDPYGYLKQIIKETEKLDNKKALAHPHILAWQKNLKKAKIDPKKYPVSIESLMKAIQSGKGVPSINPIVDVYNAISIREMIPMGGYDLDKFNTDAEIRLSTKEDTFLPLMNEKSEPVEPGEIVFAERNVVLCNKWTYKQNDTHKITEHTKNVLFRLEGLGLTKEMIKETLEELGKLVTKFLGGKYKTYILDKASPTLNIEVAKKELNIGKMNKKDRMIYEILNRGTVDVIVREDLEAKLQSGKKLKIKLGIDPTGSKLHIGHMVPIKKLAQFQKAGHHIQFLFGNFTAQIGDPTGKSEVRTQLTQKEVEKNAESYLEQSKYFLDIKNVEVVWNADWLGKLKFSDVVSLASNFTVSQMLERDMYQERMNKGVPIYVHEFMYPLMQGYDSVALESDVEIGGTDQTFNLLAGRTLQKAYGQEPQNVITGPILEGLDGHIKMSKSENNFIGVTEPPAEQYGKVMSIPDNLILRYFELATDVPLEEIDKLRVDLLNGMNPRDAKMQLAHEIVTIYYSETEAKTAAENFAKVFRKKEIPDDMPEYLCKKGEGVLEILVDAKLMPSKSEARRLIQQNAVSFNDTKIADVYAKIDEEGILKAGKRKFLRIVFQ